MKLLNSLFENKPDDYYLLIWTLQDKRSEFVQTMNEAEKYIAKVKSNKDCYLGVGYHAAPQPATKRGTRGDIAGLPGLYADVDIKSDKKFFKSFNEAGEFLQSLPLPPSMIVHSGGGLQPWWLFKESFIFANEDDRDKAERYTKGWLKYLMNYSQHDLDGVGDITRVLRVPGTFNFKYNPARPVEYLQANGCFYNLSDFDEWLLPDQAADNKPPIIENFADSLARAAKALEQISLTRCDEYQQWVQVGMALYALGNVGLALWQQWSMKSPKYKPGDCEKKWPTFIKDREKSINLGSLFYWVYEDNRRQDSIEITTDPHVSISAELLDTLLTESTKFRQTWERRRNDFDNQYKYDCSLVGFGISNGLTSQQIANLIIHHRRKHGQSPEEACKPGYIERLVTRMRTEQQTDSARAQEIDEARAALNDEKINDEKDLIIQSLSKLFGVEIIRLEKSKSDPPSFTLFLADDRAIPLGRINAILNFSLFREQFASLTNLILPKELKKNWDTFAHKLLQIAEDEAIGEEATEVGRARAWIIQYLDDQPQLLPFQVENFPLPYLDDDNLAVMLGADFSTWLRNKLHETVSNIEMGRLLRRIGCAPLKVNLNLAGRHTTRSAWKIPIDVFNPNN